MSEPRAGIRLAGGRPIPAAPSLGRHRPVNGNGVHLGASVETHPGEYVPVCSHADCLDALAPRFDEDAAIGALLSHWGNAHPDAA
jgi:hypothetical protein